MDMKPPAPRRRAGRRLGLWLVVALVAIGAGHAALWNLMAARLEEGLATWTALRRAQGWRVEHAAPLRGGWPLAATLTLDRVRIEGAGATIPGGIGLSGERMVLRVRLPRLDRLEIDLPGQGRLRVGGAELPFAADRLLALVPLEQGTVPSAAELFAERLRVGTPAGGVALGSGRLAVQGSASATEAEPALSLSLVAEALDLPLAQAGGAAAAFGRRIDTLSADLALSGPLPAGRLPAERAGAWRDGGGTLEVRSLSLRWGPVGAAAAATIALDEALQPMGAGTLRLSGAAQALDALAEAGLVGRRAAGTARAVLPLLSRIPADGGPPEVEVPATLEDRTLAIARIPVLRLPGWEWPGPPGPR